MKTKNYFLLFLCLCLLFSCLSKTPGKKGQTYYVFGKKYRTITDSEGFSQKGIASWYGKKFHGRKTANGEIYDMYDMTCAHKTLPFNTKLKVKNLDNGKVTYVRVNDRGPFVRKRIIDLSFTAGKEIGIDITGTARVKITAVDGFSKKKYLKGPFTVQVGAFTVRANAKRLKKKLLNDYSNAYIKEFEKNGQTFYRVWAGKFSSLEKAMKNEKKLVKKGYPNAFSIALD